MPDKPGPGTNRQRVSISLKSRNGEERAVRRLEGELYRKDRHIILRYEEPPEADMGRTVTLIRIDPEQVRIVRQGDIKHEQTFKQGVLHRGYMRTPHGQLEMVTETKSVDVKTGDGSGALFSVGWSYELTVMGEAAGLYEVELTVYKAP